MKPNYANDIKQTIYHYAQGAFCLCSLCFNAHITIQCTMYVHEMMHAKKL